MKTFHTCDRKENHRPRRWWFIGLLVMITGIVLAPGLPAAQSPDVDAQVETNQAFGDIVRLRADGDYDQAIADLLKIIEHADTPENIRRLTYNHLVQTYIEKGDEQAARDAALVGLRLYPDLSADVVLFPITVSQLYDELRTEYFGSLVVRSEPGECGVIIDGGHRGETPLRIDFIAAGTHKLVLSKPGYFEKIISVQINPARETSVTAILSDRDPFWVRTRFRLGLHVGVNRVYVETDHAIGFKINPEDRAYRFSVGVFADIGIVPKLYVQPGLRFASLGEERVTLNYLSVPVHLKFFPNEVLGLYLTLGPELALLLHASGGEGIDISEYRNDFNASVSLGFGYEFRTQRYIWFIDVQHGFGLISVEKGDYLGERWLTRELKLSGGMSF